MTTEHVGRSLTATTDDGLSISFLDLGGAGQPIVFAHATGFCSTVWRPVVEHLNRDGQGIGHCWAFDARGHGWSDSPADLNFHWDGTAADVLAVIDRIDAMGPGPRTWRGVGHSMGGAALILAEARRPGTFDRLWLYEPIVIPPSNGPDPGGNALSQGAARRRPTFDSRAQALANYSSKPPMNSFDPASLAGYLERGLVDLEPSDLTAPSDVAGPSDVAAPSDLTGSGVRLACLPANESQMYLMGGQNSAWEDLTRVHCPTTVVRGSIDYPGPALLAEGAAERLPAGRLEDQPGLGHFGPMEAPGDVAASIATAFSI